MAVRCNCLFLKTIIFSDDILLIDFRVQNFSKWRQKLESTSEDSLISKYVNKLPPSLPAVCAEECYYVKDKDIVGEEKTLRKLRPKKSKTRQKEPEIFRAEPSMFFFSNYKPGEVYVVGLLQID